MTEMGTGVREMEVEVVETLESARDVAVMVTLPPEGAVTGAV